MPTVGSLKVLIEGDMRPYLVTVRQAEQETSRLTGSIGRKLPDAIRVANDAARQGSRGFTDLATSALTASRGALAFAAAWAGSKIVRTVNEFGRIAHEAQAGGVVFGRMLERVGESARDVGPDLGRLAKWLEVPPEIIRSSAAELLRAGYTWQQIATIYKGAGASALLAGKSTQQGVEIATSALVSGLSVYLNQIGIVQNLSTAQVQYARELGKTSEALTDAERAQANTLLIQRATAQEVEDMPLLLRGYGGAVSDLSRVWYDFRRVLGSLVLPILTASIRAMAALLKPIISVVSWLGTLRGASREAADAAGAVYDNAIREAAAHQQTASEVERLIGRYEALSTKQTLSAEEQRELEDVMGQIRDIQPGLISGYEDLAEAINSNIEPLREYARALKDASAIEVEIAAMRAQQELPALRKERDRVIAERDALIAQNRSQFLEAQRLRRLSDQAMLLVEQMGTEAPEDTARTLRELDQLLQSVFGADFVPGVSPTVSFVVHLQDAAKRAEKALGPLSDRILDLDAEVQGFNERIRAGEDAIAAWERVQKGQPIKPEEPAVVPQVRVLTPDEVAALVGQARLRLDAVLRGMAEPRGMAEFRLLDEASLDKAAKAADDALAAAAKSFADTVARERETVQRLLAGEQVPTSWAQLKLYDESTLEDGLRVGRDFLADVTGAVEFAATQERLRMQRVLDGSEAPTSWAALKLLDESTLQEGADAAVQVLGEIADQVAASVQQERMRLQRVLEGEEAPTSWGQLKLLDETTLQQGAEAGRRVLEDTVRFAWEQARMIVDAIERGTLQGTAPGHFRLLEDLSMQGVVEIETGPAEESLADLDVATRRAEEALRMFGGALPGVQEALEAYRTATAAASAGGLGLSAAGGAAAAALAFLIANSKALGDAIDAVAAGLAALLAPIDALLEMLGPKVSGALVGAAAGAAVGSLFGPVGTLIGAGVGAIAGWLGGAAQEQASAAELLQDASEAIRQAAEDWREFVSTAPLHELFGELADIERRREQEQRFRDSLPPWIGNLLPEPTGVQVPQEILDQRKRIQDEIKAIEKWGVWPWERSRYEGLKDALREVEEQIRDFQENAAAELEDQIRDALGIGWRDLADGVRSAFQAETLGEFTDAIERELKLKVRNALITAFLESAAMQPLFDALSDSIFQAVRDGMIDAGELGAIEDIISQITDNSAAFFEVLDALGLSMDDLTKSTNAANEALRNVPTGFKIALGRFDATEGVIPGLADGGLVTRPIVAQVGDRGPEAVIPLDRAGLGTTIVVEVHAQNVYGVQDLKQVIREAVDEGNRRSGMASYGLARGKG